MAQITALLNGENINQDYQITALARSLINPWVVSGLQVSAGSVSAGEAFLLATRTGGQQIMLHYTNTHPVNIDTTGTAKIYLVIDQAKVDNGSNNAPDGTGLIRIERGASYPASNFLPLASITGGIITDERKKILQKNNHSGFQPIFPNNQWTKICRFKWEASRLLIEIIWSGSFWANETPLITYWVASLYIGNNTHARNCTWIYTKVIKWNNQFNALRIVKISPWEYDIYILSHTYSNWTFVRVSWTEWSFDIYMENKTAPNVDWDNVYDIQEANYWVDIAWLPEISNPTNAYDFFIVKEFAGVNKKVTLENLRRWIIGKFDSTNIVNLWGGSVNVPNWCHAHIHVMSNISSPYIGTLQWSPDNSTWTNLLQVQTQSNSGGTWSNSASMLVKAWFVKFTTNNTTHGNAAACVIQVF